jgi:hypothetical protein
MCKFHHNPTGNRDAGHTNAAGVEIAVDVIQHQHDNLIGERESGHRPSLALLEGWYERPRRWRRW